MNAIRSMTRAPALIRWSNPLANALLRIGTPMGPNRLMTIRGRASGKPHTAPVAIVEIEGRRYVIGAYGPVNWVLNLRAAGEADVHIQGRVEHVRAVELDAAGARNFFGRALPAYIAHFPWFGRAFARLFFGLVGPELLEDPARAAELHPVFELQAERDRGAS